jgi:hypothetical protein
MFSLSEIMNGGAEGSEMHESVSQDLKMKEIQPFFYVFIKFIKEK